MAACSLSARTSKKLFSVQWLGERRAQLAYVTSICKQVKKNADIRVETYCF